MNCIPTLYETYSLLLDETMLIFSRNKLFLKAFDFVSAMVLWQGDNNSLFTDKVLIFSTDGI